MTQHAAEIITWLISVSDAAPCCIMPDAVWTLLGMVHNLVTDYASGMQSQRSCTALLSGKSQYLLWAHHHCESIWTLSSYEVRPYNSDSQQQTLSVCLLWQWTAPAHWLHLESHRTIANVTQVKPHSILQVGISSTKHKNLKYDKMTTSNTNQQQQKVS